MSKKYTLDQKLDESGNTTMSLHVAAEKGDAEQVKSLLEQGADINTRDENGRTPFQVAVWNHHFEVVKLLLKYGSDINAKDGMNDTSLCKAIVQSQLEIAKFLIEQGANIEAKDRFGRTPVYVAEFVLNRALEEIKINLKQA